MTARRLLGWFATCWLALMAGRLHADTPEVLLPSNYLSWLVSKIESTTMPGFYGTALLYDATGEELVFITNAHVLPRDQREWPSLRLTSPLKNYEPTKIRVIGQARGEDVAVISVPFEKADKFFERSERASLLYLMGTTYDLGEVVGPRHVALVGIPGDPWHAAERRPALKCELWGRGMLSRPKAIDQIAPCSKFSGARYPLALTAHCPPLFVDRCYYVPIVSWGFSGSALVYKDDEGPAGRNFRIAGLVSHFSPLSPDTYAIPINKVLATAKRIRAAAQASGEPSELTVDAEGTMRLEADGSVTLLKGLGGDAAPHRVRAPIAGGDGRAAGGHESSGGGHESSGGGHESSGGGHESSGGGHESSGGGHESSGGGHESSGGGSDATFDATQVMRNKGSFAAIGRLKELFAAAEKPLDWVRPTNPITRLMRLVPGFKGVDKLFGFGPGVRFDDDPMTVHQIAGQPVASLSSFLTAYRLHFGAAGFEQDFASMAIPRCLTLRENDLGLRISAITRAFRTPGEIGELIHDDKIQINDTGFPLTELAPLMTRHKAGGDLLVTHASNIVGLVAWVEGKLMRRDGRVVITARDNLRDRAPLELSFPDQWQALGPWASRYVGEVTLSLPEAVMQSVIDFDHVYRKVTAHARVDLQWLEARQSYEIKVVLAHQSHNREPRIGFLAPERLNLEGLYFPLDASSTACD